MKQTINCCEYFAKIRHSFEWFNFTDDEGKKVYVMPCIRGIDGVDVKVQYCPSCGTPVRGIEMRYEEITQGNENEKI